MKILIICNHMLFRESIRRILVQLDDQLDIKEESHLGTVVKKIDTYTDIELMVYYTGQLGAAATLAVKNIHAHSPGLSIVVLSESNNKSEINSVIEAGAQSYISMTSTVEDLLEGLKKVLDGEQYISAGLEESETINGNLNNEDLPSIDKNFDLSERQYDVLNMILLGQSNKEIARSLEIGEGTVKSYCSIIYRKLDVENRAQAIIRAKEF